MLYGGRITMENKLMYVEDQDGKEVEMEILFTFDKEEKKYVVFRKNEDESEEIFASCYDDEGNLSPIDSGEEWAMIEEVLGAFIEDGESE